MKQIQAQQLRVKPLLISFLLLLISCLVANSTAHSQSFLPRRTTPTTQLKPIECRTGGSSSHSSSFSNTSSDNRNYNLDHDNEKKHGIQNIDIIHVVPRGGSLTIDVDAEESESSFMVTKIRNIIRSMLEISEKKSSISTSLLKVMVKFTEKVTGLKLLPEKKKKQKKSKKPKKKNKDSSEEDSTKGDKQQQMKKQRKNKPSSSGAAQSHLSKNMKMSNPNYRIQRELKEFLRSPPPNLSVKVGKNIRVWIINMTGTKGSLYEGDKYRLKVTFPADYPTSPPSVYFLQPTPRHEHVYTNGDICLSLLGKDWRPTMTAQSLANSILSILSGAGRRSLPMDNVAHAQNKPGGKQDDWIYHDDNC